MEQFVDPTTARPLNNITLAEGETRIVALKKYALGPPPAVIVLSRNPVVAICHQVSHLLDPSKQKYDNLYDIGAFTNELVAVERKGLYFYQIAGQKVGNTELSAPFRSGGTPEYASPLTISVTAATARPLVVAPVPFSTLWWNHPLNPHYPNYTKDTEHPDGTGALPWSCPESKGWLKGPCMTNLCTALKRGGASFFGLKGATCGAHSYHFINPYDFAKWKGGHPHFIWEAKPPFQPEPMPGIAAFWFLMQKTGIVLFWNYYPTVHDKATGKGIDMFGGHIDLWNKERMGNTYAWANPYGGESAFLRARRIEFWLVN